MLRNDPAYHIGNLTAMQKVGVLLETLRNPLKLIIDRMALRDEVEYLTRTGIRFVARSRTTDVNEAVVVLSGREYPPELLDIDAAVAPVVLDCGGHIGSFSLYVKNRIPTARVLVFEPLRANLELIRRNLQLNGFSDVTIITKALYGTAGRYYLDLHGHGFDGGTLCTAPTPQCFEIQTITLEEVLGAENLAVIDVMKMDIEGSEFDIVEKSLATLERSVTRLVMEYHPNRNLANRSRDYLLQKLTREARFELIYETANILGFRNAQLN